MLELSKEQLEYLRRLLVPEINVLQGWLRVSEDEEVRGRRQRQVVMLEEMLLKVEVEIPRTAE